MSPWWSSIRWFLSTCAPKASLRSWSLVAADCPLGPGPGVLVEVAVVPVLALMVSSEAALLSLFCGLGPEVVLPSTARVLLHVIARHG